MLSLTNPRKHLATASKVFAIAVLAVVATHSIRDAHIAAQDFPVVVGRIEGDDLEVVTTTPSGIEKDKGPTVVASGSDITLRSGHALLLLNAGGKVSICGPAHFKMIKTSGALTLALDYGRVHPSLESADEFTIYTPTIVATPIAIAGGPRDMTVGLDQSGEMCVLTARGAMRVEPQFSEQSMIVPQGGTVNLAGGQIESLQADASACSCDFPRARVETPENAPPPHSLSARDVGALASPLPPERKRANNAPAPSSAREPVFTVLMPPLTFDANAPEPPPEPAPETVLLVREVRLRPSIEFRGHVNPAPTPVVAHPAPPAARAPTDDRSPALAPTPSLLDRVRTFFRRFTSSSQAPCAGAGCNG
ncbi:MAG TPA: hypothetical protein VGP19_06350 [Candidatus Acidoferrales bacterium]|nr:hypothetical protein [Candidatus Acidoferrales bacterium]